MSYPQGHPHEYDEPYEGYTPDSPVNQIKTPRPMIVCLCGSTRFMPVFTRVTESETLAGNIVLSVGVDMRTCMVLVHLSPEDAERVKANLDALHKQKIELADEILVINVNGYIGDSTKSEIQYAAKLGKRVRFLVDHPYNYHTDVWGRQCS